MIDHDRIVHHRRMMTAYDSGEVERRLDDLETLLRFDAAQLGLAYDAADFERSITSVGFTSTEYIWEWTHDLDFETLLEHPDAEVVSSSKLGVELRYSSKVKGIPVSARLEIRAEIPEEYRQILIAIGRIKWEVPEPSEPYLTLACGS